MGAGRVRRRTFRSCAPVRSGDVSTALSTDFYELTMATSYLRRGMHGPATFSLFVRRLPPRRGFLVCAGLSDCLDFLEAFRFTAKDVAAVAELLPLTQSDRNRLRRLQFTGEVWAVPEGSVVTAGEPLLEVTAPIAESQLVETALLNFVSFQTNVATKAARCRLAAPHAKLVDFAMRRTQSLQAATQFARASAIAGFDATSNLLAARTYGLLASGTMAHSYVQAFPGEDEAFAAFASDFPDRATLLVDTYDTIEGVRVATTVIRSQGIDDRAAIRLDSGDLGHLAGQARGILDAAGLSRVTIVASGSLDEYALDDLVRAGAPIDAFGVGTKVGVAADTPYLDTAYKLVDYAGRPVFKLSAGKATVPARKQIFRGAGLRDQVGLRDQAAPPGTRPLLRRVMTSGRRLTPDEPLSQLRSRCAEDLAQLSPAYRRIRDPEPLTAPVTPELRDFALSVGAQVPAGGGVSP